MKLTLAIEASSATYAVALGTGDTPMVHQARRRDHSGFRGVGDLVSAAVAEAGGRFAAIEAIGVDIGPGNLSSVRAAVAYANGLGFSLGVDIFCANSLELMAMDAAPFQAGPALCLRVAGDGNVYAGLFASGQAPQLRFGPLAPTITALVSGFSGIAVAGAHREETVGLLPGAQVHDTGIEAPSAVTLYRMMRASHGEMGGTWVPSASPLNEGSRVFHE